MKANSFFDIVEIDGEFMLIPLGNEADTFQGVVAINEPVAFLFKHMDVSRTIEELSALLVKEYEVEFSTAMVDVNKTIKYLKEIGVVIDG